jgi:hypothetical protein
MLIRLTSLPALRGREGLSWRALPQVLLSHFPPEGLLSFSLSLGRFMGKSSEQAQSQAGDFD